MNKYKIVLFALSLAMAFMPIIDASAQQPTPLLTQKVSYHVYTLPQGVRWNVSFVHANFPQPSVDDQNNGDVLRLGGSTWDTGVPIAAILTGNIDKPWVLPLPSGLVDKALQFTSCGQGVEVTSTEPFNDFVDKFWVAPWAITDTTFYADDIGGHGAGISFTVKATELLATPSFEFASVRLPNNNDGQISAVDSCTSQVYRADAGWLSGFVLGWRDGNARGVGIVNGKNYDQPLQVPACTIEGREWANDLSNVTALLLINQMLIGPNWQQYSFYKDDVGGQGANLLYQILWRDYVKKVYQPVVMR